MLNGNHLLIKNLLMIIKINLNINDLLEGMEIDTIEA